MPDTIFIHMCVCMYARILQTHLIETFKHTFKNVWKQASSHPHIDI